MTTTFKRKQGTKESCPPKPHNLKRHMHPMFIGALFTIVRTWKQPQCPLTDEWIKMWCIYMCIQWNFTHPEKE